MFNKATIATNLYGLVGFDDPADPTYAIIDSNNTTARSGRKYTDNPYAKIDLFIDNMDYDSASDARKNAELKTLSEQAIIHVCDKVFDKPDYIDRQLLYQFANNKIDTDTLPVDHFVGYRIYTSLEKNIAFKIPRIYLEFEGTGELNLYLFNSAISTPIQTKTVDITSNNQVETLDWIVDYSGTTYYKGEFYIGYLANEAISNGLTPIERDYHQAIVKSSITYLYFENIEVPGVTSATLWDLEDIDGAEESWGLNPEVLVYYDYTDLITHNEFLFARAIQLQGQINFLSKIAASTRSNINERLGKDMLNKIMIEIEGIVDTNKIGLKRELLQEITHLRKEVKKLKDGYFANGIILNTMQ